MRNDSLYLSRLWLAVAILLVAPALASAQTTFVQPRITAAIDNTSRVTIPHSTHPLALPAYDTGSARRHHAHATHDSGNGRVGRSGLPADGFAR